MDSNLLMYLGGILVAIISFFLTAFFKKVDIIITTLKSIEINLAVSNQRIENLEKRVSILESKNN